MPDALRHAFRHALGRFAIACCLGLAACGGGGGGDSGGVGEAGGGGGGGGGAGGNGSLTLAISGLPSGAAAAITVTGPGQFRQAVVQSTTLSNLAPGSYTVTAGDVLTGSALRRPQPPSQAVAVTAGTGATASVAYGAPESMQLSLTQVPGEFSAPIFLTAPAGDARLFVVERAGRIRIVRDGALLATPFLDINALTTTDGERGLLSMAFDPDYAANGRFYVYYTDTGGAITIARYQVSATNPDLADASGTVLLSVPHPNFSNHNGGQLAFGPDRMLYIGTGDGGGGGDPAGNAQNAATLLGKMLRIDVSGASGYGVPAGNPFVGQSGSRGEIWALGLRNPWRFSFDAGSLYIADVGQEQREEVDVSPSTSAGLNYGWNLTEGTACVGATTCDKSGLTMPVFEYGHEAGGCAIVGGYVYRGSASPALQGRYFYSDLCTGKLQSFLYRDGVASEPVDWNVTVPGSVFSFGVDSAQALYVLADPGTSASSGRVYRIDASGGTP
ncbi:sorbosone dehydrogenase family protein [Cupriavidus sp. MP-37]|uniref:PQQ-dependent sugar dehydrogenase n=1 Tax=Cupriavidus sp. MP-37 TaxID=2884455 RepID=UPI001D0B89E0|nr:PQQ-dependent sugar dehydrogenase [Cupriavidus sp. MP-37]UDM52936.1 PQQ-dependent sugar dehydrogenase [Cupriavidus sp. MP-37]